MTEFDEYDFGSNQPGSLLRKTVVGYAALGNNILDHTQSVTVCTPGGTDAACNGAGTRVAQTTFGYDESSVTATSGITQHVTVTGARGNVTSVHRWLNTNNTTLNTSNTFDDTGHVLTTTDPGGHVTSFTYGSACNGAFGTQTTMPDTVSPNLAHHTTSATYDCNTGLLLTSTDQNSNVTKFFYDNIFRLTEVDFADGGQTLTSYPSLTQVIVKNKIDSTRFTYSTTLLDGYGRLSRKAVQNDETTPYDQQDFCYDSNGRLGFKSYPYQGNGFGSAPVCSGAVDAFTYDALGRPTKVTHSDGTAATTSYTGKAKQIIDEGNGSYQVTRILQNDALGRLAYACEISSVTLPLGSGGTPGSCGLDISGTGFLTAYGHDTLDNLTTVTQGLLTSRTYTYDSLSRLTSESTPEAGIVSYGYNADSLLATRTRPQANQTNPAVTTTTSYQYDPLHRLTSRTYSGDPTNTPGAQFVYDTDPGWGNPTAPATNVIGRLTEAYTSPLVGAEILGYDSVGRVIMNNRCTPLDCGSGNRPMGYTYDFLGDMTSASNGVGVTFTNTYNIAGRLTGMTSSANDAGHPGTLLSNAHYSPTVVTDTLGNGVVETANFSSRGQLQSYLGTAPSGEPGTGSVTINGTLQTYQQQTQAATPGTGSVTISGTEKSKTTNPCAPIHRSCPVTIYDAGTISVTVDAVTSSTTYGQGSTTTTIATNLANAVNNSTSSPVSATSSGSVIMLTAKTSGAATNYSLSATSSTNDPTDFGSGSFFTSTSGGALTGGQNAVYQTVYDNGSTTITVNIHPDSYSWSGSGTSAASIAQGLCNVINGDSGAPATASTSGIAGQCPLGSGTVSLVSKQNGQNYPLTASSSSVVNSFSTTCPGFPSCSGASLTGGTTVSPYSFTLGLAPDGQITSANDFVNGNWAFAYDQFNRLASSNKNSGQQTFSYAYDRYANRWQQNAPQGGPAPQYTFDNNNHFVGSGVTYDALGNVLTDGLGNSFTWDAESRLVQVKVGKTVTAAYVYDAEGRRVRGPNGEYVYDLGGGMITQIALNGVWAYGEIYAGGRHLATYSNGTTNFFHADWLGTKRVMTGTNGAVSETCTGFAFGDGVTCTGTNWTFNGFTDDIHDPETNLEHTLFRQYSGTQGRWLIPDPAGTGSADPSNPQTWNRYAYVMNNAVNAVDPLGLDDFSGWEEGYGLCGMGASAGCGFLPIFPGFGCLLEDLNCGLFNGLPNFAMLGIPPPIYVDLNGLGILPGEYQIPFQSLADHLRDLLAGLPWNNTCAMSPISDLCGFTNGFAQKLNPYNCLPYGASGPRAPGLDGNCQPLPFHQCIGTTCADGVTPWAYSYCSHNEGRKKGEPRDTPVEAFNCKGDSKNTCFDLLKLFENQSKYDKANYYFDYHGNYAMLGPQADICKRGGK